MYNCTSQTCCRYPWHVVCTGIRILVEAESVLDSYFVSDEDTGNYIGYQ